jgi:hypothetical protein
VAQDDGPEEFLCFWQARLTIFVPFRFSDMLVHPYVPPQ